MLAVAGFEAVYGIVEYASGHQHIFQYAKVAYLDSATGTFVNRNQFANYMVMALCLTAGAITYRASKARRKIALRENPVEKVLLLTFYAMLLGAAVLFSRSRAGMVSLMFAMAGMGVFYARSYRKTFFAALIILAVLVAGFSVWLGVSPLPKRFLMLPDEVAAQDARPAVWAQSLELVAQAPVLGHGLSMYKDAFRAHKDRTILARYHHAHNDYLEILVETGVVGLALWLGGIAAALSLTILRLRRRKSRFALVHAQSMVVAVFASLFHAFTDFNMQIPANQLTFFAVLGLGWVTANRRLRR